MTATEDFLRGLREKTGARVGYALTQNSRSPDDAAEALQIGSQLGVPASLVSTSPDSFRKQAETMRATTALSSTPKTAAWMQDVINGTLAKDDLDNLTWFERNLGPLGRAAGRGVRRTPAIPKETGARIDAQLIGDIGRSTQEIYEGLLSEMPNATPEMRATALQTAQLRYEMAQGITPEERKEIVRRGAQSLREARGILDDAAAVPMSDAATRYRDGALEKADNSLLGFFRSIGEDPTGAMAFITETAAEFLPALAVATGVTAATRSPGAGAIAMGSASALTENTNSAMEFLAEKGADLSTPAAAMAVLENTELMAEAADRGLTRGVIIGLFDAVSGGVAGQQLVRNPAGEMIAQGLAQILLGSGGEATAQAAAGQEIDWKDIAIEGLAELATAPVEVLGVGGRAFLRRARAAAVAGETAAALRSSGSVAATSKLRERSVEKFQEALEAQGLGDNTIYVPAEGLRTYFQAKDINLDEETLKAWGVDPVTFEEMAATGQDVAIPMSNYAARIAGGEDAAWFEANATTDPDEMSLDEVKAFNESVSDIMAEAFAQQEDARIADEAERASDVQIKDAMFRQLRAAGRSPDVANAEATLWSAFWRTMGRRTGEDPLDLANRMGVEVRGPGTPDTRLRGNMDLMLNTLRSQGEKALKPKGASLSEWVVARGGVRDEGGEIADLDPPKGLISESRQDMAEPDMLGRELKGSGLDDMARAAAEAGYIAEASPNALLDALSADLRGERRYLEGEGPDEGLTRLSEALSERAVDLSTVSNDEALAALEAGQTYNQPGRPDVETFVKDLKERLGLRDLSMFISGEDLKLNMIAVNKDAQGKGAGTRAMEEITRFADANGLRIVLTPGQKDDGFGTTSRSRLVKFYKRFGFVENKGRNKDFAISESMYREPEVRTLYQSAPVPTETPEFAAWFGDSKVVDENGEPLVVYHGTPVEDISRRNFRFSEDRIGSTTDAGHVGRGFYFANTKGEAEYYGPNVVEAYLSIQNPLVLTNETGDLTFSGHFKSWAPKLEAIGALSEEQQVALKAITAADQYVDENVRYVRAQAHDGSEGWMAKVPNPAEGFTDEIVIRPGFRGAWPETKEEALDKLRHDFRAEMERHHPEVYPGLGDEHASVTDYVRTELGASVLTDMAQAAGHDGIIWGDEYIAFRPEQIKSVHNRGTFDPSDPRILYQPAWHGSPHIFDRFSTDYMGTGEGAQAFGWGLYFAGKKEVSEFYRDKLTRVELSLDGKDIPDWMIGHNSAERSKQWEAFTKAADVNRPEGVSDDVWKGAEYILPWSMHSTLQRIRDKAYYDGMGAKKALDYVERDSRRSMEGAPDGEAMEYAARLAAVQVFRGRLTSKEGRLYKVDIPEDSDLLAWDRPLSEQPEGVKEKIRSLDYAPDESVWDQISGQDFYEQVRVEMMGDDAFLGSTAVRHARRSDAGKAASLALQAAGIPGHRFLDQGSRSAGEGSYNYVIYDDAAIQILEFEQSKRGAITLPSGGVTQGTSIIQLFEGADLSTVLHESGHFFLEAFTAMATDGPEDMQADLAAIRKFVGNDGGAWTTEQHETWARGIEAYLLDGKAPSLELADAFARFKAWLTRIYRSIKGLNVKLTPEVTEVMDRMLATDMEIAEARAEQSMSPLFAEAPPGMSESDFKAYQRMARRGVEQAEQSLLERTMAKVRREKEAWYKAEKKAVREEVENEYNRRREYRLINVMANGVWIGSDDEVPDMRLDRKVLVEQFGEGVIAELSRVRLGGKRAIYGGDATPQEAAEFFGFEDANEMIRILQNTRKKQDAIAEEVERRMVERHGDPLNDGTIEEEALVAIHSEQQANASVAEARHIAKQLGRETRGMKSRIYRQRARLMLGRMSVREVLRPTQFLAAERKAARAAQDAFTRIAAGRSDQAGALAAALQAKEQQILNGFLYDEARKAAKDIERGREKMRAYDKKTVREKLEGGYIEQIDAILEDYDFRVRSRRQVERAESLQAFVDRMTAEGREAELNIDQRLLDQSRRRHYSRLSLDEIRGLFDTVDNLDHLGRFKQKLIDAKRKRDLLEVVDAVEAQIESAQPPKDPQKRLWGQSALNLIRRPDTIFVSLDGGDEMGTIYDAVKLPIDEGQAEEQKMQVEMATRMDDLFRRFYSEKDLRDMQVKRQITDGRMWSKAEILSVALNTGNPDNFQRLMDPNVAKDSVMDRGKLDRLLQEVTPDDWSFVQAMWSEIDSYWPRLAEIHRRRTGVDPKKVQAQIMVDAPASVRGGYYPIKYDPTRGFKAAKDEGTAWDKFTSAGHGSTAAVANGMTKQRENTGGGRTLLFDLSVPFNHLRETIRYIALSEAVDNAHRILNHPRIVDTMQARGQRDTLKTLNLWLKDTARGPIFNSDLLNTLSRMVKNNFTLSRLAFNFKTIILQATGLGQSAATIGKRNMVRGMSTYARHPAQTVADVTARSPFMAERKSTFQKDIYDFMNDAETVSPLLSRWRKAKTGFAKWGFAPIVGMQFYVVDMPTWLGAYAQGLETYGNEGRAATYADSMVKRAQDSGLFGDRAAVERGTVSDNVRQADFIRLFTTLAGYMLTKINRAQVTAMQARKGIREADSASASAGVAVGAAIDMTLLFAFEAALMGLIYALATDEEDDEDLARFMLEETGMALVGGIPFVRDAASAFRGYGGGGVYGSVLEVPAKLATQIGQGEMDAAFRRSVGDTIGIATGLPSTAALRAYEGLMGDATPAEMLFGANPLTR